MQDGKCLKHFPKKFVKETNIDKNAYPVYRRRDNKRAISKSDDQLDNRYVVPYNPQLLLKYDGYINVEQCNQ